MEGSETQEQALVFDEGEKRRVIEGGVMAMNFARKIAMGKKVDGKRYGFDSDFIKAIHGRILARSDAGGRLREENVGASGINAVSWHEVPSRFYLFSKWLQEAMRRVASHPEDVLLALEVAAAAHYGLTQPDLLHPFASGNGRTARVLTNAILMHNSDELRLYGVAIPPIPILRSYNEEQDKKYIKSLRSVTRTGTLNPLMIFIAKGWIGNLGNSISRIERALGRPKNEADRSLMATLKRRRETLTGFVSQDSNSRYPIPNYFETRWTQRD